MDRTNTYGSLFLNHLPDYAGMHVHEVVKHVIVIFRTEIAIVFRSLSNQNDN